MPTIIENLNTVIQTKSELKSILSENGLEPSENFYEYPDMFRSIVGTGGGADEEAINGYIAAYLSTYNFIDQTELSANSYATTTYVADYVATYASGGSGSITIDENIIPKENYTYSLGASSYIYKTAYVTDLWTSVHNKISNGGDLEINMQINNDWRYVFHTENFSPATNNITLGTYTHKWANTYTSYLYCDINGVSTDIGYYLSNINGGSAATIDENIIPKESNTYTLGDSTYFYSTSYVSDMWLGAKNRFSNRSNNQVNLMLNDNWRYVFHINNFSPADNGNKDLGQSSTQWRSTYTNSIYADNAYISNYNNLIWTGTAAQYALLDNYTTYQFYLIQEA